MANSMGRPALIKMRRRCGFHLRCHAVSRVRAQVTARFRLMMWCSPRHSLRSESLQLSRSRLTHCRRWTRGWARHDLRKDFFPRAAVVFRKIDFSPGETARTDDMQGTPLGKLQEGVRSPTAQCAVLNQRIHLLLEKPGSARAKLYDPDVLAVRCSRIHVFG